MGELPEYTWSKERKAQLRKRILLSAEAEQRRRKKRKMYWCAAAVLVPIMLLMSYHFILQTQEPSIEKFVNQMQEDAISPTENVTVVLGKGNKVVLEEDESQVQYSETGSDVIMGNGKRIEQQVENNNKPTFNTVIVPYGKRSFIKLSDGTKVWINSGSKLVFPVAFTKNKREVYLEGEAIFDVTHDKKRPFLVKSKTQNIEVLGTVFNVSHYSDDKVMNTVLKSGSIKITYMDQEDESFVMKPGTMSSFNQSENQISVTKVNAEEFFTWKDGYITLSNSNLTDIAHRISRYYNIPIKIQDSALEELTFSGRLDLSEEVDKVLSSILASAHINVEKVQDTIVLTSKLTLNNTANE